MIRLVSLFALSLGLIFFGSKHCAAEEAITGLATHIRDIDTLEIDGIPIRLNGLDGPELSDATFLGACVVICKEGDQVSKCSM